MIMYKLRIIKDNTTLHQLLAKSSIKKLILLNHSGGGTEKYIKQNFYNSDCFLLTQCNYYNGFCYCIHDIESNKRIILKNYVLQNIILHRYKQIIVNTLVGFTAETEILDLLKTTKEKYKEVSIIYLVHDFHSICPSVHLHYGDFYCNIECTKCGNEKYRSTITERLKKWFAFLSICDEIRTFSQSSKQLLLSAFNQKLEQQISVVPHNMSYCKFKPIVIEKNSKKRIAIVGSIMNLCKGMKVVGDFLRYCVNKDVDVYIIGTLCSDYVIKAPNIHYFGKYKSTELSNILQINKINTVFFPSILPETFSYLVHELMIMQIPILGFDIGAQGEYLASYKYGLTLPVNASNKDIYNALISL